jgi:rubredoxin
LGLTGKTAVGDAALNALAGPHKGRKMALKKFSEVAEDGCCPKCGYAVMKRGVNAVTGNLAVGLAATLVTGGVLGPARKTIKCGGCGAKYLQG